MPFEITAIQTQGRSDGVNTWDHQWVKSYKLSYGNDGINWSDVKNDNGGDMVRQIIKLLNDQITIPYSNVNKRK